MMLWFQFVQVVLHATTTSLTSLRFPMSFCAVMTEINTANTARMAFNRLTLLYACKLTSVYSINSVHAADPYSAYSAYSVQLTLTQ